MFTGRPMQHVLFSQKFHSIFLGLCWVLMQLFLLRQFGVHTTLEAAKYIEQANLLLEFGSLASGNFLFYSVQILLIAVAIKLGAGFWVVVLVQLLANAASLLLFYKLVYKLTRHPIVAFTASSLLLCMVYYQLYNVYLYTESLFFSLTIVYTFVLFQNKKWKLPRVLSVLFVLLLLIFTRPTGVLFIPPTIFFLIFRHGQKRIPLLLGLSLIAGLLVFYLLLDAILNSGGELNFLLPYVEEHVICGVPLAQQPHIINAPENANSVKGLWFIVSKNRELFLRLAGKRLVAFWGVQRPYYSFLHNAFVAVYFYSLYILILFGLRRMLKAHRAESTFCLSYIFLVMLTVMLSCDEWHNRFLYSLLPLLLLMATGIFARKS